MLPKSTGDRLRRRPRPGRREARATLAEAIRLREILHEVFSTVAEGRRPGTALRELNALVGAAMGRLDAERYACGGNGGDPPNGSTPCCGPSPAPRRSCSPPASSARSGSAAARRAAGCSWTGAAMDSGAGVRCRPAGRGRRRGGDGPDCALNRSPVPLYYWKQSRDFPVTVTLTFTLSKSAFRQTGGSAGRRVAACVPMQQPSERGTTLTWIVAAFYLAGVVAAIDAVMNTRTAQGTRGWPRRCFASLAG